MTHRLGPDVSELEDRERKREREGEGNNRIRIVRLQTAFVCLCVQVCWLFTITRGCVIEYMAVYDPERLCEFAFMHVCERV